VQGQQRGLSPSRRLKAEEGLGSLARRPLPESCVERLLVDPRGPITIE
jgi:hypothetical protein